AEVSDVPASLPVGQRQRRAVGLDQAEIRQFARLRIKDRVCEPGAIDAAELPVAEPQPGASGQRCDENDPDERAVRSRGEKTHPAIIAFAFAYTCACQQARDDHVTAELASIIDLIRYGASRFAGAGLTFGHSYDSPLDEASHLVLHSLHLPLDLPPAYGAARLTAAEKKRVLALIERRVRERKPVAYLTG